MKATIRFQIFEKYSGKCAYCGVSLQLSKFHVDHIISKQHYQTSHRTFDKSANKIDNLNPSCPSCNLIKKHLSVEDFRKKVENIPIFFFNNYHLFRAGMRFSNLTISTEKVIFYFEK